MKMPFERIKFVVVVHTGIARIDVVCQLALGELKVLLWDDLVEGEFAAVDDLARIAVTRIMQGDELVRSR